MRNNHSLDYMQSDRRYDTGCPVSPVHNQGLHKGYGKKGLHRRSCWQGQHNQSPLDTGFARTKSLQWKIGRGTEPGGFRSACVCRVRAGRGRELV